MPGLGAIDEAATPSQPTWNGVTFCWRGANSLKAHLRQAQVLAVLGLELPHSSMYNACRVRAVVNDVMPLLAMHIRHVQEDRVSIKAETQ